MADQIIQAPFVKIESMNDLPQTTDPLSGKILYFEVNGSDVGILKTADISKFKDIIVTGIAGEATPSSSPTPYVPADYPDGLFEKWDVKTAGTYTNFLISPGNPVQVTTDDLKDNFVQIWVTNGVSQKVLSEKPENTTSIPPFEDLPFPVAEGTQATYGNSIWEVKPGQTVIISDIPSTDVNSKWISLGLTLNSTFNNYINPALEVGGIALNTGGTDSSVNTRGRTAFFYDIAFASQIELIGDMLIQSIFYYTASNVFISREDISAKIFIPTIPGTAAKFKLSFFHTTNTQEVTLAELNALTLNCYSATPTTMKTVVNNSTNSVKVTTDYSLLNVNVGAGALKESGRIVLTNGNNIADSTGLRTGLLFVSSGSYTITPKTGYKISRVVNYKDGVFVGNNTSLSGNNFTIDSTVANNIKLVFEKTTPTDVITAQEIIDFTFTVVNNTGNKLEDMANLFNKPLVLPSTIYTTNQQTVILNTVDTDINFDLTNRKLIISGGSLIDSGNVTTGRISLPTSTTGIDMPSAITAGVVLYNRSNNTIVIQNQTAAPLLNHYILFTYRYSGAFNNFFVTGLKNYSVNGLPISQKDMRQSNRFAVDNFSIPYWNSPTQTAYDPSSLTSTSLYILYDALVEAYSSNVTKTVLGQTTGPTPYDVIRLDISFNKKPAANQRRRKPKIFVCGGIHGGEKLAVYSTYLFFKFLLENPNNDEIITSLKNNYDWTVIPLVNPYALNVGQVGGVESVRWNHNGVDINRNFDFRWSEYADGGVGSQSYKGTAAFSEKESQFVRDVFNTIKDDVVLYLDCHNFGSSGLSEPRCVWFASTFNTVQNIVYSICDRIDYEFKKRFSYLPQNTLLAFSDIDGASPMSQSWVSNQQVVAVTLETDQSDFFNPVDPSNFNSNVMTRSLEAYINAFYSLGKHAVELYNSRL